MSKEKIKISKKTRKLRNKILRKIKHRLMAQSFPRIQMSIIVLATAAAAFLISYLLLSMGLNLMGIRYALTVFFVYPVFLFLVKLWLEIQKRDLRVDGEDIMDTMDIVTEIDITGWRSDQGIVNGNFKSGGGDFGGGGADGSFGEVETAQPELTESGGVGSGLGFDIDFDLEGFVVFIIAAAVLAGLIASIVVVLSAPTLFTEVLLNTAVSVGLYKRLKKLEKRHWLEIVIKKTWLPFLVVLIFFFIAGIVMQNYAPEANSIGGVLEKLME